MDEYTVVFEGSTDGSMDGGINTVPSHTLKKKNVKHRDNRSLSNSLTSGLLLLVTFLPNLFNVGSANSVWDQWHRFPENSCRNSYADGYQRRSAKFISSPFLRSAPEIRSGGDVTASHRAYANHKSEYGNLWLGSVFLRVGSARLDRSVYILNALCVCCAFVGSATTRNLCSRNHLPGVISHE